MKDNKETNERELTGGDDFKSLFLDAAINFGSENYSSSKDYNNSDKPSSNNCAKPIFKFAKKPTHTGTKREKGGSTNWSIGNRVMTFTLSN